MEDEKLINEMYDFAMELAQDLKKDKFSKHREKWNTLLSKCEIRLGIL